MTGLVPSKDILTWAMPHLRKNKGEQKTPEMWCWAEKLSCMTHCSQDAHLVPRAGPTSQKEARTQAPEQGTVKTGYPSVNFTRLTTVFLFFPFLSSFLFPFLPLILPFFPLTYNLEEELRGSENWISLLGYLLIVVSGVFPFQATENPT